MTVELLLILLLFTKHFIVDFPLQNKYQWSNKGIYGHPGGIVHSGLHGWVTYLVFLLFVDWPTAVIAGIADMVVHYHIDWAKMNLNAQLGLGPTTHEQFWWMLGLDQYLHAMTYVGLIYFLVLA
jgi:hypothetical protein